MKITYISNTRDLHDGQSGENSITIVIVFLASYGRIDGIILARNKHGGGINF